MATPVLETTDVLAGSPWIQKHQGPFISEAIIA